MPAAALTLILPGQTIVGSGFTVTVAVTGVPGHPLAEGVMVNVTVCGTAVLLVSEPLMVPVPAEAMPDTFPVLSLVHVNVVPLTPEVGTIAVIAVPVQIVCDAGVTDAAGVGFTFMVNVPLFPEQTWAPLL